MLIYKNTTQDPRMWFSAGALARGLSATRCGSTSWHRRVSWSPLLCSTRHRRSRRPLLASCKPTRPTCIARADSRGRRPPAPLPALPFGPPRSSPAPAAPGAAWIRRACCAPSLGVYGLIPPPPAFAPSWRRRCLDAIRSTQTLFTKFLQSCCRSSYSLIVLLL